MRKISILVLAFGLLIGNVIGAPLVLKVTKEVKAGDEIALLETAKYKKILVGVMAASANSNVESDDFSIIKIYAVDSGDSFFMDQVVSSKKFPGRAIGIENLPAKLSLVAEKAGTYQICIWAE